MDIHPEEITVFSEKVHRNREEDNSLPQGAG